MSDEIEKILGAAMADPTISRDDFRKLVREQIGPVLQQEICGCGTQQQAFDAAMRSVNQMLQHDCINWLLAVVANMQSITKTVIQARIAAQRGVPVSAMPPEVTNDMFNDAMLQYGMPFLHPDNGDRIDQMINDYADNLRRRGM